MGKRLRVGNHHGITIVEHDGDEDRGRLVAVVAMADVDGQTPSMLAQEICDAVNATRRAAANVVVRHSTQEWS